MRTGSMMRFLGLLCALLVLLAALTSPAVASRALITEKEVSTSPVVPIFPLPDGQIEGACGVAAFGGQTYVSDYYHHAIDIFGATNTVIPSGPDNGFCGLASDGAGNLYANLWHESVVRVSPSFQVFDEGHESTGVAVDQVSGNVYVDDRTYVAVYEPSGAPVLDGEGDPLRIGLGNLEDAFGVAVSAGKVYVPDAADNIVKVFEPAVSPTVPSAALDTPSGFHSLVDAAVAVDPANGHIVVVDNLQPGFEHPEATVEEFDSFGVYRDHTCGRKFVDGEPSGLAFSGGNLHVTSGNDEEANVFLFGPYSPSPCPPVPASLGEPEGSPWQPSGIAGPAVAIAPAASAERVTAGRHRRHKRPHRNARRHKSAPAKARGRG